MDQLTQEIGRKLSDADRAEKFRLGLRPRIKARMNEQAVQVTTHRELVAQAQRIKGNHLGNQYWNSRSARTVAKKETEDTQAHNGNNNKRGRGQHRGNRGAYRSRGGRGYHPYRGGRGNYQGGRGGSEANRSEGTQTAEKKQPLSEAEKTRRREKNLCFYCGKPNHLANACPEKTKN